jgi:hypothetical protein
MIGADTNEPNDANDGKVSCLVSSRNSSIRDIRVPRFLKHILGVIS